MTTKYAATEVKIGKELEGTQGRKCPEEGFLFRKEKKKRTGATDSRG